MRIFITGGTGFIGPYVVNRLIEDNHHLLLLSNREKELGKIFSKNFNKFKVVSGNLSNIEKWKKTIDNFSPDLAIHMAWEGIPDYKAQMSVTNLQYGLRLFLALAEIGCKRILTTGSCWEYGKSEGKLSEEMNPTPANPFTVAKNALRTMGVQIAKENEIQFIWTRFFYVYGPRQKSTSLIPYIINSVLKQEEPKIRTPNAKNDFIFVEDVANAIGLIIENCRKNQVVYNIGSGYSTSVREIIELAYEKSNTPLPSDFFTVFKQPDNIVDFWADISKIRVEIGWEPKVSISEGIERMLNYYRV